MVTIELDGGVFKEVNMKNFLVINSENSAFRHEGGMSVRINLIVFLCMGLPTGKNFKFIYY